MSDKGKKVESVAIRSIEDLKKNQTSVKGLEDKLEGFLKPKANPHEGFAKAEKIRNAAYEVPQGLTEEQTMLLTIGAMLEDRVLDKMVLGEENNNERNFLAMYVYENVFSGEETEGRLGNVPIVLGEARENAAQAFKEYANGNSWAVKKMGEVLVKRLYEAVSTKFVTESEHTQVYGLVAKKVFNLMNHPDLGLQNLLNESEKEQLRFFANACEMKASVLDAEVTARENLPEPGSKEREELLKKVWLHHNVLRQTNLDVEKENTYINDLLRDTIIAEGEIKNYDIISKDPVVYPLTEATLVKLRRRVMLPPQIMLSNEEDTKKAMDAYWEQMKQSETYKNLMQSDQNTFYDLLEAARKQDLPEIHVLDDVLKNKIIENEEKRKEVAKEFTDDFHNSLPKIRERVEAVKRRDALVKKLEEEKSTDRLAGSMKTMQEYVSVIKTISGKGIDENLYKAYLESMEQVVEKTEALYEKTDNGEYVPLTKENLKELQTCYKNAYLLAKQTIEDGNASKQRIICNVLENNIVTLGMIDKKNLMNLPDVMTKARTVFLDVTGSQMEQVRDEMNVRTQLQFTDIDGKTKNGYFTEETKQRPIEEAFRFQIVALDDKYPKLKPIGKHLLSQVRKHPELPGMFKWEGNLPGDTEQLSADAVREAFLDNLLANLGDVLDEKNKELIQNNRQEALGYFIQMTDVMSANIQKERVYRNQLGLSEDKEYRIDTRNVAVYSVAELLGVPNIVAKAQQIQLQDGSSKPISGTFTEMAEGVDITKLPKDHEMRNYGEEVYNNGKGIKSLADMQILDYICLNAGRHPGKMLYQFDTSNPSHPKFTGVQGIGNEASFGLLVDDKDFDASGNVTKLEDLGVISKGVFDSIMEMDMEIFRLSLKTQSFHEKEMDAACIRLEKLKNKVLEDAKYFEEKEPGVLESGKIRIVSDEEFEQLTLDKVLDASPNAKIFRNIKEQVMGNVPYANRPELKEKEQQRRQLHNIVYGDEKKTVSLDVTEVNLGSKNYYEKIQRDLSKFLLETNRADSVLRGSSKEYKAVQKALKESIELLGKIEEPNLKEIEEIKESLNKITAAVSDYKVHKREKHSGSEYEKKRISVMDEIHNSIKGKEETLKDESKKYFSRVADDAARQERTEEKIRERAETKQQVKKFVSNITNWNEKQSKGDLKKALASVIVTGGMAKQAFRCYDTGKQDKMFQMTQEEFDKQITKFSECAEFEKYYESIDKEMLAKDLAGQKPIESYMEDFKKAALAPEVTQQQKQEPVKETVNVNESNVIL